MTQGAVIRDVVTILGVSGWTVAFFSMPNTAHVDVVPIPVASPNRMQRYPDVVAFDAERVLLVEVEPSLSVDVETEIRRRFRDHDDALSDPAVWAAWKARVEQTTGLRLPPHFLPLHQLVVCRPCSRRIEPGLEIVSVKDYAPPPTLPSTIERTS